MGSVDVMVASSIGTDSALEPNAVGPCANLFGPSEPADPPTTPTAPVQSLPTPSSPPASVLPVTPPGLAHSPASASIPSAQTLETVDTARQHKAMAFEPGFQQTLRDPAAPTKHVHLRHTEMEHDVPNAHLDGGLWVALIVGAFCLSVSAVISTSS